MRSRRSLKLSHTQTSIPCGTLNKSHSLSFSLFHKPTNGAANGKHRPGQDEQLLKVVVWIFSFQLNPN